MRRIEHAWKHYVEKARSHRAGDLPHVEVKMRQKCPGAGPGSSESEHAKAAPRFESTQGTRTLLAGPDFTIILTQAQISSLFLLYSSVRITLTNERLYEADRRAINLHWMAHRGDRIGEQCPLLHSLRHVPSPDGFAHCGHG